MADFALWSSNMYPDQKLSHQIPSLLPTPTEQFLELLLPSKHPDSMGAIHTINTDIHSEVMTLTLAAQEHYWRHWVKSLPASINPYLQNLALAKWLLVLHIFAQQVQEGKFG